LHNTCIYVSIKDSEVLLVFEHNNAGLTRLFFSEETSAAVL